MKKILPISVCFLLIFCMIFASCSRQTSETASFLAMDTLMNVTTYGDDANAQALAVKGEIERLDTLLSAENPDSELSRLNAGEQTSSEVLTLTKTALTYCALTHGTFDITLHEVSRLWGFGGSEAFRVPTQAELQALASNTGYEKISLAENSLRLPDGMTIDLGGIAKGYASDCAAALLTEMGATSAILSLGGNIRVLGSKPDGSPYTVGIQDPASDALALSIDVRDTSVITSGSYQRYFEENGKIYHHILDPSTLSPAQSGLLSATVVCKNGAYADALSTALFVMGKDEAIAFWRERGDFDMILIDAAGQITYTPELSPQDQSGGTYQYHEIEQ